MASIITRAEMKIWTLQRLGGMALLHHMAFTAYMVTALLPFTQGPEVEVEFGEDESPQTQVRPHDPFSASQHDRHCGPATTGLSWTRIWGREG